jgi:hypothetical protein
MTDGGDTPTGASGRFDFDATLDALIRASLDDLAETPAPNPPSRSIADRIDDERLKELTEARRYRRATVKFTLRAVGGLDTFATAFMIAYVASQWHHIEPSVIIAYFSSVVVQSIGVLYVISKYLFPQAGPRRFGGDSNPGSN